MEKDITRRAVERAAESVTRVLENVRKNVMPYGPSNVKLTPRELRGVLEKAQNRDLNRQIVQNMDEDQIRALLRGNKK